MYQKLIQRLTTSDPEDDKEIISVANAGRADTSLAIAEAPKAFETYRLTPHRQRRWLMRR